MSAEVSKSGCASLRDLAAVYAAVLARHDVAEPISRPAAEQLRAVVRGAASPAAVPLDDFELIYTEGDSNNTRSMRVRYNAMLAQAAYNVDPTPDAATSYAERQRLFALPRSSWQDYDKALISEGGGIFSRSLKSIPLSNT